VRCEDPDRHQQPEQRHHAERHNGSPDSCHFGSSVGRNRMMAASSIAALFM
jgi:hypothetical protein